jgi:integrase
LKASKISTDLIRRYIAARQKAHSRKTEAGQVREYGPAANATINRELSLLRRSFTLALRDTPPKVAAVPFIPVLAENNDCKGFFERDDFLSVRRELPEEIQSVITFGYFTGCRKGEILALGRNQVDFAQRTVRLEPGETKNREARLIPLAPELFEILKLEREKRDRYWPASPWVFSRVGEPILDFRSAWDSACKRAELVDDAGGTSKLFHDLRRTGVRNLVRAGVSDSVAMKISGHRTRSVFDRYNVISETDIADAG